VNNIGAVYLYDGATLAVISTLKGGTLNDNVGSSGIAILANGNYVVRNPYWSNPTGPIAFVGAVTWGNGAGGTVGLVTSSNSLIGGTAGDQVGDIFVFVLTNGNYYVGSGLWDNPTGPITNARAYTLGNGTGGTVGLITSANSVLGTVTNGISSAAFSQIRNRLVVGRAASNLVSLFDCSFCTAQQATQTLIARVNALVPVTLTAQKANSLTNKLDSAIKSLDKGNTNAACAHLQGFIQLVNNYISAGFLTPAQGQPLINAATTIRMSLGCR
jgi:hypothetical protein